MVDNGIDKNDDDHIVHSVNDRQVTRSYFSTSHVMLILLSAVVMVYGACCNHGKSQHPTTERDLPPVTTATKRSARERLLESEEDEQALVRKIAAKLQPVQLDVLAPEPPKEEELPNGDSNETKTQATTKESPPPTLKPHQFLHLHHMKTGGTSMDHLMRCAMDRLRNKKGGAISGEFVTYNVPYYSIHECSRTRFAQCLADDTNACRPQMNNAAVMSYCSALKHLEEFGWTEWDFMTEQEQNGQQQPESAEASATNTTGHNIKAFTVLRHPVERVWSMFKFQTRLCYKCMPLKDIYEKIDSNDTEFFDELCLNQLRNHEVANLLTSQDWPEHPDEDDQETQDAMVAEAIENMKKYFTVIGLTEELEQTARLLGTVFPWMNETIEGHEMACPLPHDNGSPKNNRCIRERGKAAAHWDLPKHPDEETAAAIMAHNKMDMKLYEAAVSYFELQKRALDSGEEAG